MIVGSGSAKFRRIGLVAIFVAAFCLLNYYFFVKPARDVKKRFKGFAKAGYTSVNPAVQSRFKAEYGFGDIDPNDPSHAGIPKLDFDPRAALSDQFLTEKFFFSGYNLTKRVPTTSICTYS